jgi:TM2 domain-containing membrane protein YozV
MAVFCPKCGAQNVDTAQSCTLCQAALPVIGSRPAAQADYQPPLQSNYGQSAYEPIQPPTAYGQPGQDWQKLGADKKLICGICAILLGGFGVHKFILGYTNEGIIQLVLGLCFGIGGIIGIIEGIIYLTKSDEEFVRTYIQSKKGWF